MNHVQRAIDIHGSVAALARGLHVTSQAVCFWRDGKRTIPAEKCIEIERLTSRQVRCEDLRPDADWAFLRGTSMPAPPKEAANA